MIFSLVPSLYILAVSKKLPPASAYASIMAKLVSLSAPQPFSVPKPIVPRHNSETLRPERPSSLYFIDRLVYSTNLLNNLGFNRGKRRKVKGERCLLYL